MAVEPEEFERVRALVGEALGKAYAWAPEAPIESEPGHWLLWPVRRLEVRVEETRLWSYGVPGGGTGRLQIHVERPYAEERFRPSKDRAVDEKLVRRAVEHVVGASKAMEEGYGWDRIGAQTGHQLGYLAVQDLLLERDFERLRAAREAAGKEGAWDRFHRLMDDLERRSREMNPALWATADADPQGKDMFVRGAHAGIDDRERGAYSAFREPQAPSGVKEWTPPVP